MVWKAGSVRQIFQSGISHGEVTVNDMWKHLERMSYQGTEDIYFMQKRAELMGSDIRFRKFLLARWAFRSSCWRNPCFPGTTRGCGYMRSWRGCIPRPLGRSIVCIGILFSILRLQNGIEWTARVELRDIHRRGRFLWST